MRVLKLRRERNAAMLQLGEKTRLCNTTCRLMVSNLPGVIVNGFNAEEESRRRNFLSKYQNQNLPRVLNE